jgi:putative hydrolase of the HAD superfamily
MAAVIFDLDDTLYPHVRHVHSGFAAVATYIDGQCGVPAKDIYATLRRIRELGYQGTEFQRLCEVYRLDSRIVTDLIREYQRHRPQLWLKHGVSTTLHVLRESGWRTALLTNGDPVIQAAKVRALGLEALVDHMVYASEYALGGKPAREPFLEVLRRLQVAPHHAVMVGDDHINDIEGARALGIRTIFLAGAGRAPQAGADAVVHLLNDVPRVAAALVGQEMVHAA